MLAAEEEERQRKEAEAKAAAEEAARKAAAVPKVGDTFRDCPECPEMVVVPAGSFTMGSSPSEIAELTKKHGDYFKDHGPQHDATIRQRFAVGKFEVTFDEWAACESGGGCQSNKSPSDEGWGKGRRPVINVSWNDAKEYVAWLSKKTAKTYRLLTEAEWEYAARATTTTRYFWGDTFSNARANNDKGKTVPVGQYEANAWGLHDMHGNVWEWVEDCYGAYKPDAQGATAVATGDCSLRVNRGGSWLGDPDGLRSAVRGGFATGFRGGNLGFRVGRTLTP
jgi:formylglycine-generating enzyme required for sulfatase activity